MCVFLAKKSHIYTEMCVFRLKTSLNIFACFCVGGEARRTSSYGEWGGGEQALRILQKWVGCGGIICGGDGGPSRCPSLSPGNRLFSPSTCFHSHSVTHSFCWSLALVLVTHSATTHREKKKNNNMADKADGKGVRAGGLAGGG